MITRPDGTEAAVDEPGEIRIRGHNVMKGYLNRPEATALAIDERGWFRTGDIGRRDADGYYYIVDRQKDMVIRGGVNVYPRERGKGRATHPQGSPAAGAGGPHGGAGGGVRAVGDC